MDIPQQELEKLRAEHATHAQRLENMEARRRGWPVQTSPQPARVTIPAAQGPQSLDQLGARVCNPGWEDEQTEGTSYHMLHPVDRTEGLDQLGARIYGNWLAWQH